MEKVKINVKGRVQGVGFRYMTKMVADKLGVHGKVWNEKDGSVSIEAVAKQGTMKKFLEKVKASPSPHGKVTEMVVTENENLEDNGKFVVVYL